MAAPKFQLSSSSTPSEGVDDNDDWNFGAAIGGESVQCVNVNRKLLDLQDECYAQKGRVPANVTEAVELYKELLRLALMSHRRRRFRLPPMGMQRPSCQVGQTKLHISKLESTETLAVCRHKAL